MYKYLNNAFYIDFLIVMVIGGALYFLQPILKDCIDLPSQKNLNFISGSIISIGATLIGFLLTIITVIITFKKGYSDSENMDSDGKVKFDKIPVKTIFGKVISKESKFYESPLHKIVTNLFIVATYEIGFVIFTLVSIQFNIVSLDELINSILILMLFLMLVLTTLRTINVFRLFLKIHTGN